MSYIGKDFLLTCRAARKLYRDRAEGAPILDYHCHLDAADIDRDRRFADLAELWLEADHYKWRLMRAAGVEERLVTGGAPGVEKFRAFCAALPLGVGNPLHHWCHLELARYFGIGADIGPASADTIWELARARLAEPGFSARAFMERSGARLCCTTDDPLDPLEHHGSIAASGFGPMVLPGFRPDRYLRPAAPDFRPSVEALGAATGIEVESFDALVAALAARMDRFSARGCILADHALDGGALEGLARGPFPPPPRELDSLLEFAMAGEGLSAREEALFRGALLVALGREYARRGWAMMLHVGALRDRSSRLLGRRGRDAGGDAVAPGVDAEGIGRVLDALDAEGSLPRTVLFCMDPAALAPLALVAGCFQDGSVPGKVQLGPAWWHEDHADGIRRQLLALARTGAVGTFIGMTTDSRSFTSYVRHDYFRRILCSVLGEWAEAGECPRAGLGDIVEALCWKNAENFLRPKRGASGGRGRQGAADSADRAGPFRPPRMSAESAADSSQYFTRSTL